MVKKKISKLKLIGCWAGPETHADLARLAARLKTTKSGLVRDLIRQAASALPVEGEK